MKMRLTWMVAAVVATACGGSDTTAPPSTPPFAASTANANGGTTGSKSDSARTATSAVVEGTVSALSGTCPKITFTVAGKSFTTDSLTRFGDGGCAAVKNDAKVGVAYQTLASGAVRVRAVKVMPPPPPPPPPPVTVQGTVSALSGSCPKITFTVAGKTFTTDSLTRFGDGGCAAVQNDAKVGVAYQTLASGAVRVLAVKVMPPAVTSATPSLVGEVSAVSGSCPAITITVAGKTAVTSATTAFVNKTCQDVKVGVKVGIFGTVAAGSSSLTATRVVIR